MNSDSPVTSLTSCQVHLKTEGEKLLLILPPSTSGEESLDWEQSCQDLKYYLKNRDRTWQSQTAVHLLTEDRLLDIRQLQTLAEILQEAHLQLQWVRTSRRQTAVAAAISGYSVEQNTALGSPLVEAKPLQPPLADPLYLKTTVRSGVVIRHAGTVILQGDINPGGEVIADGNILIWGSLRGLAHAGAKGNSEYCIMALRMEPTQLRIAQWVARAPSTSPNVVEPEIAYVTTDGIRLTSALNFTKTHVFHPQAQKWLEKSAPNYSLNIDNG